MPVPKFNAFPFSSRHQIQHYTGQLAKDTSKHLRDMNSATSSSSSSSNPEMRQWRLQRERLHADFTKALNSFQAAQRTAAQKEKDEIKRAKQAKGAGEEDFKPYTCICHKLVSFDK